MNVNSLGDHTLSTTNMSEPSCAQHVNTQIYSRKLTLIVKMKKILRKIGVLKQY